MREGVQTDFAAKDREVRAWMADPHRFFKAFSRTARRFQRTHRSPRFRVMTLVGGSAEFLPRRPLRLHMLGRTVTVRSWPDVLAAVVSEIADARPDLLRALDARGMLSWLVKPNPSDDVVDALAAGGAMLRFETVAAAFEATQWIALMADVKLNEVVVQVDPFTDAEWRVRERELLAKRDEEVRVLREIDLARQRYAEMHGVPAPAAEAGETTDW